MTGSAVSTRLRTGGLTHTESKQPIGKAIAIVAMTNITMLLQHLKHAEYLVDRAAQSDRDIGHRQRFGRRGEQFQYLQALLSVGA